MVSTRDLENVVAQINVKFEQLTNEIVQLKKQVADNTGAENGKAKSIIAPKNQRRTLLILSQRLGSCTPKCA